jgi:hypothetical protein
VFGVKGWQKAGLPNVPIIFVGLKDFQDVPQGLSLSSEDAGPFSSFPFVIPIGNFGHDFDPFDEPAARSGVLAFVTLEQGQVGGSLEAVIGSEGIFEVIDLLICHFFSLLGFFNLHWGSFLFRKALVSSF